MISTKAKNHGKPNLANEMTLNLYWVKNFARIGLECESLFFSVENLSNVFPHTRTISTKYLTRRLQNAVTVFLTNRFALQHLFLANTGIKLDLHIWIWNDFWRFWKILNLNMDLKFDWDKNGKRINFWPALRSLFLDFLDGYAVLTSYGNIGKVWKAEKVTFTLLRFASFRGLIK